MKAADRHSPWSWADWLDATQRYDQPLTQERLFGCTPRCSRPAGGLLDEEMRRFLAWYEGGAKTEPVPQGRTGASVVRDDSTRSTTATGASREPSRTCPLPCRRGSPERSTACRAGVRGAWRYYRILEETPRGRWTSRRGWGFLACLTRAIDGAQTRSRSVIAKALTGKSCGRAAERASAAGGESTLEALRRSSRRRSGPC